jgi:FAD/FMN-containing dehydrogenase
MGGSVEREEVAELGRDITGEAYARGDEGLADEAACFNTAVTHDPDVVVAARTLDDIVAAVVFAGQHGLPVFVQATGHGAFAPIRAGLLVSTRHMDAVSVDAHERIATIAAGARWGSVLDAAARYGLTPVSGSSASVGAIGYTLGGGLGPLARTYGFTSDWVRGFTLVTADAQVLRADADTNEDLFWALRGGKGGLGIVAAMDLELVAVSTLYGGGLFYGEAALEPALRAWVEWAPRMPDAVTSSIAILRFPDVEEVPPPMRGRLALHLRYAFVGDADVGERLLEPMRAAAPVFLDLIGEMPASTVDQVHDDPDRPGPAWDRGMLLSSIDQDFVTALLDVAGEGHDLPFVAIEVRHIGGASIATGPASAVGGRGGAFTLALVGVPMPELFDTLPDVSDRVVDRIRPWIASETNINFLGHVASTQQFVSAWPADTYERLTATRAAHDPAGRFPYPT